MPFIWSGLQSVVSVPVESVLFASAMRLEKLDMRYLLLVSHGTFAPGLHSVLDMLLGPRDDILSCSMEDGMGADVFVENLKKVIEPIGADDEVICFGDIIGGSPLTNTLNTLSERGLIPRTVALGGMNLPMAITAAMETDSDIATLRDSIIAEGKEAIREVDLALPEDNDEEDI
jgi:Phosphotransferase system, mannose/fructose-specific component IIA